MFEFVKTKLGFGYSDGPNSQITDTSGSKNGSAGANEAVAGTTAATGTMATGTMTTGSMAGTNSSSNSNTKADAADCRKCNEYKDWLLRYSPSVRFMQEQVQRIGGNINSTNIVCGKCDEMKSGGFHPELGILLCQNKVYSRSHAEDTLTHELVHAYDHCRFDVDWSDLRHHACSEIRASSLSGECRMMNEFLKHGHIKFGRGHQDCVRRRATLSVMGNPNCPNREAAETVVDQIFDHCFNDTRPFDEIYR